VALVCVTVYNDADYEITNSGPHSLHHIPDDSSKGWKRVAFKYTANCEEIIFATLPTSSCMCFVCLSSSTKDEGSWFPLSDILYW
jgi:hypothetical protein